MQVRNIIDLLYSYIKKDLPDAPEYRNSGLPLSCCDALCQARLRALTTVHLRGLHFKVGGPRVCGRPGLSV